MAEDARDNTCYIRAAVYCGDLMWQMGNYETAKKWLQLALDRFTSLSSDTDVLDLEVSRARTLLDQMADGRG